MGATDRDVRWVTDGTDGDGGDRSPPSPLARSTETPDWAGAKAANGRKPISRWKGRWGQWGRGQPIAPVPIGPHRLHQPPTNSNRPAHRSPSAHHRQALSHRPTMRRGPEIEPSSHCAGLPTRQTQRLCHLLENASLHVPGAAPLDGTLTDVGAVLLTLEVDERTRFVRALSGSLERVAHGRHVEYAAA